MYLIEIYPPLSRLNFSVSLPWKIPSALPIVFLYYGTLQSFAGNLTWQKLCNPISNLQMNRFYASLRAVPFVFLKRSPRDEQFLAEGFWYWTRLKPGAEDRPADPSGFIGRPGRSKLISIRHEYFSRRLRATCTRQLCLCRECSTF